MNSARFWLAPLVGFLAAGCGQQLVQFGEADLSPSDQAIAVDAAMAIPDLGMEFDFSQQPDLALVADLQLPLSDLRIADLMIPDLLTSDLRNSDLFFPDLMTVDFELPPFDGMLPDLTNSNFGTLGSLEYFAVVAGSTITNVGPTTIIGSIGLFPGPMITGIPMGMPINGSIHIDDGAAVQAQMDLAKAYDFLAGKPCGTNLSGVDLGGKFLAPGVYCYSSSAGMAAGTTLILDSQGDPNASWTFQIGSTLILGNSADIHVINGGRDCSVYWQVGSSATFGIGSRLAGSILAKASITMTAGASAGRVLAENGGVTMDTNDVTIGPCH